MTGSQFTAKSSEREQFGLASIPENLIQPTKEELSDTAYLRNPPPEPKWSSGKAPPQIGDRVELFISNLGFGTVVAYFVACGWFGLEVKLDAQPDWHAKQNGKGAHALVFGNDLNPRTLP